MVLKKRVFKQLRSRKTYEAILAAAAEVFPKKGFEGTQVPDLAVAAGISTGAVYRYFDDKREIFLEMLELHLTEVREQVAEGLDPSQFFGVAPAQAIAHVIDVLFDQVRTKPALGRVFLAMSFTDKDVRALRVQSQTADRKVLATLIGAVIPKDRVPDPAAAAFVIQNAAISVATEYFLLRARDASEESIKRELASAIGRYLAPESPETPRAS